MQAEQQQKQQEALDNSPADKCVKKHQNFFNAPERVYFPTTEDGDVDTLKFLEAVEDYVKFFQTFGVIFKLIVQDALGQLEALRKVYSEHKAESGTLGRMLDAEQKRKEGKAAIELLWLRRGLGFYSAFLELMYENARLPPPQRKELGSVASMAYEQTLTRHHGFFTRSSIKLAYKAVPYRATINQRLWYSGGEVDELELYSDAMTYRRPIPAVVTAIDDMFTKLNIDTSSRAP